METSRETRTEAEGTTSIRLRYSWHFQNGGHAHTIDAETTLAVGTSSEKREQIIRELEAGVELLARQIAQRGSRPTGEAQASTRPATTPGRAAEPPTSPATPPRPAPPATQPAAPLPVSESMPATPTTSGERTVTLPNFLHVIKNRWDMTSDEARELLNVNSLTGLNYREAFATLRAIKEAGHPPGTGPARGARPQAARPAPPAETRRGETNRTEPERNEASRGETRRAEPERNEANHGVIHPLPSASTPAPDTTTLPRAQVTAAPRHETRPTPRAAQATPSAPQVSTRETEAGPATPEQEREVPQEFAGSAKGPLPIHFGIVRDTAPHYAFEEEDSTDEEYELPEGNAETAHRRAVEAKLAELKAIRTSNTASPERLTVLNNVVSGQISDEQLDQLIKIAWNVTTKKKLKILQVEALISWAKDDYFTNEVEALLALADEEEE